MTSQEIDCFGPKPLLNCRGKKVENVCPAMTVGMDYIRNTRLFKAMAFNLEERQRLGNFLTFNDYIST